MAQMTQPQPAGLVSRPDRPISRLLRWAFVPVLAASVGFAITAGIASQDRAGLRAFAAAASGQELVILFIALLFSALVGLPGRRAGILSLTMEPPPFSPVGPALSVFTTLLLFFSLLAVPHFLYGQAAIAAETARLTQLNSNAWQAMYLLFPVPGLFTALLITRIGLHGMTGPS
jgi:hypothetical protein